MPDTVAPYKLGINTITPAPTGDGGAFIVDNFKAVADLLEGQAASIATNATSAAEALAGESAARASADATLANAIATKAGAADLATEAMARADADATLTLAIADVDATLATVSAYAYGRAAQSDLDDVVGTLGATVAESAQTAVALESHRTDTTNPHAVTYGQVGAYSVAQVNTLLAGKATTSHTHTASQISDSTTAGRALLTAADATAQRTALALGTAATLNSGTASGNVATLGTGGSLTLAAGLSATTGGFIGNLTTSTRLYIGTSGIYLDAIAPNAATDRGMRVQGGAGEMFATFRGNYNSSGTSSSDAIRIEGTSLFRGNGYTITFNTTASGLAGHVFSGGIGVTGPATFSDLVNIKLATVATLGTATRAGVQQYATNGRKPGEGSGAGTGVPVMSDTAFNWISAYSGVAVTA